MTGSDPAVRRARLVLAVCCLSLLITVVDTTAVNVALPAIGHDLNAPVTGLQWTIDGYTLAIASFMMLAALIYAIIEGAHRGYGSAPIVGLLVLAAAGAVALPTYERRRAQPLIDPRFFGSVPFTGAFVAAITAFLALSGFLFLNTLYLQDVRGYSALQAGLLTVPMAGGTAVASTISGRLTAACGARTALVAAGVLIAAGAATLTALTPGTPLPVLLVAYLLFGAGSGIVNAPITDTAVAGMPRAQAGVSAAITTTGRQIGNSLGVAVLGSIADAPARSHADFTTATHLGWWILAGCGALVATLGVLTTSRRAAGTAARVVARFPAEPLPAPARRPAPGLAPATS